MTSINDPDTGIKGLYLYDAVNHQLVIARAVNVATDAVPTPNVTYGDLTNAPSSSADQQHVFVDNANANGQATMANSSPVVIASDQSAVPIKTAIMAGQDGNTPSTIILVVPGLYNGVNIDRMFSVSALPDGSSQGIPGVGDFSYNNTNWDRVHNNLDNITLLTSASRSSNTTSNDQTNFNGRGCKVYINPGAFGVGATNIQVTIQGKDPVTSTYYTILASPALAASTFYLLTVYPGVVTTGLPANESAASDILPRTWRISATASAWGTGGSTIGVAAAINI